MPLALALNFSRYALLNTPGSLKDTRKQQFGMFGPTPSPYLALLWDFGGIIR